MHDFQNTFTTLAKKWAYRQCRTIDKIYNDAGFTNAKELEQHLKAEKPHLQASYTTLRHWAQGRTIPRYNVVDLVEFCTVLNTNPLELALASFKAQSKFKEEQTRRKEQRKQRQARYLQRKQAALTK